MVGPPGIRTYLLVHGGLSTSPTTWAARATFLLGVFGGHGGLPLRPGDVLRPGAAGTGVPATAGRFRPAPAAG